MNVFDFDTGRRAFLERFGLLTLGGLVLPSAQLLKTSKKEKKLVLLHTNDTHSNIDPFPASHAKFPNQGGVSKRFELIKAVREQEENVLLLDAGDIFQGTPYFNKFGGIVEMKAMSAMGYDVVTMGNHDFDGGIDGFVKAKSHATFEVVCSNYDVKNTALDGHLLVHKVIEKDGLRIGIFGLGVELEGLVPKDLYQEVRYLNPVEIAQEQVRQLRQKKCDLVICLSHLGYSYESAKISDCVLATKTEGIDIIIGGHTHTFLDRPTTIVNAAGQETIVNQVGWGGLFLGRIDIYFSAVKKYKKNSSVLVQ